MGISGIIISDLNSLWGYLKTNSCYIIYPSIKRTVRDKPYDPSATCYLNSKVLMLDRWEIIDTGLIIAPIDAMGAFLLYGYKHKEKRYICLRFMSSVIKIGIVELVLHSMLEVRYSLID